MNTSQLHNLYPEILKYSTTLQTNLPLLKKSLEFTL